MSKCPTCGAPAGPSAPDGDFRYRPPSPTQSSPTPERTIAPTPEALKAAADALPITWGKQLVIDVAGALDAFAQAAVEPYAAALREIALLPGAGAGPVAKKIAMKALNWSEMP